jgi:hypothetical protein
VPIESESLYRRIKGMFMVSTNMGSVCNTATALRRTKLLPHTITNSRPIKGMPMLRTDMDCVCKTVTELL